MKTIVCITIAICSIALGQGTQMDLYDYQMQANANVKLKNGKIGLVTAKPAKNAKEENIFGYWLSNNTNASSVFLEIKEGAKTIASVTAKDFSAKAKFQTTGSKTVASYSAGSGASSVALTIEADIVTDASMPLGKAVAVEVKAKTAGAKNITAVMTLFADGFVKKVGTNGLSNSRVEKGKAVFPLLLIVGNSGTTASTEAGEQKAAGRLVKLSSDPVAVSSEETVLLSFRTHTTTVKSYEKSFDQADNVERMITAKKEKTELSLLNSASKGTPSPGDTITYTITYHNIGTSAAQDIVISNPIPQNTMYVENSAEGAGAEITVDRKKAALPQVGEVTSVNWKVTKKVLPGEEGTVSLKAVIR
jgi:uncharacterized repeat protein (TIGR01451 family)